MGTMTIVRQPKPDKPETIPFVLVVGTGNDTDCWSNIGLRVQPSFAGGSVFVEIVGSNNTWGNYGTTAFTETVTSDTSYTLQVEAFFSNVPGQNTVNTSITLTCYDVQGGSPLAGYVLNRSHAPQACVGSNPP